jgi:hypothetical protein
MDVELRHHIAERRDVDLVAAGERLERAAAWAISLISCACSIMSRSVISTARCRRGTSSSQG